MMLYCIEFKTPLGDMIAVSSEHGVCLLEFVDGKGVDKELAAVQAAYRSPFRESENDILLKMKQELRAYFSGSLKTFATPVEFVGTPFQQSVWRELQRIPYGSTISYATQAARLGNPKAVRAVAAANGQNKISIIVPCHRVIGSNGALTGYAGGIGRKQALLQGECGGGFSGLFD